MNLYDSHLEPVDSLPPLPSWRIVLKQPLRQKLEIRIR